MTNEQLSILLQRVAQRFAEEISHLDDQLTDIANATAEDRAEFLKWDKEVGYDLLVGLKAALFDLMMETETLSPGITKNRVKLVID